MLRSGLLAFAICAASTTLALGQQTGDLKITFKLKGAAPKPQRIAVAVQCNVRPWLEMRLLVLDHPYAAVSDENGELTIKNLPAGKKLVFRAFHERGTFQNEIYINGKQDLWKRNRFAVTIQPGLNDLGSVEIPATEF